MGNLVADALAFGFSRAAPMDPRKRRVLEEIQLLCSPGKCSVYDTSWTCPPAAASVEVNRQILARYSSGLIVQSTGPLLGANDQDGIATLDALQKQRMFGFRELLWQRYPNLLALGNGPCTYCDECTYPDAPCRHPDSVIQSMAAFGLIVSEVCANSGLGYNYGPNTLTFTGCYLLETVG